MDFTLSDDFIDRLADRAEEAERLRRLPEATMADVSKTGFLELLLPARYGGKEAPLPSLFEPVRRMAHGCTSSAWTLGFYALHNWMLGLFSEQAQDEVFADGSVLAPAPLAPTGKGETVEGGIRLSGRWSWATGIMAANWVIVGAIVTTTDSFYPALVVLPADEIRIDDVWHTSGMRGTGSNDVIVESAFVPEHRILKLVDIYSGTTPGARLHGSPTYRWPMVPALALTACMPVVGTAEHVCGLFAARLRSRIMAYSGVAQRDQPTAHIRLASADIRLRCIRALLQETAAQIEDVVNTGDEVPRSQRAQVRLAAAHAVHESRAVIADLMEAAGASVHFLNNPMQRAKRDVDIVSGHAVFDYDTSRELAGALQIGADIPPTAMI